MKVVASIKSIRKIVSEVKARGGRVGFVPTMGALHEGHLSLIRQCRKDNDLCVVSIFVNPTQFGPGEDYGRYPRNKHKDCRLAKEAGADVIFYPSVKTMYPSGAKTSVVVGGVSQSLCGASRPGHFEGVATVVSKLFHIVGCDVAYFGQKDFQQTVVIKQMVYDLNIPVKIKVCKIIRENDGLAMSSRNAYLTDGQRQEANVLYRALKATGRKVRAGERKASTILSFLRREIQKTSGKIDYLACIDAEALRPVAKIQGRVVIAVAVFFGKTRLIDNIILQS